jgi:threonylcarbamoyladenosine tRNA methylthiotransferase MtaB
MPDAAVGVDILAGFPGETADAFENTYNLIKALPISYLHVFPFSERPGTPASKFVDKIPTQIIKQRCERMRRLGWEKRKMFYQKFRGQTLDVLIEETTDRRTGLLKGVSSNYLPVLIDGSQDHINTLVPVKIDDLSEDNKLLGTIRLR